MGRFENTGFADAREEGSAAVDEELQGLRGDAVDETDDSGDSETVYTSDDDGSTEETAQLDDEQDLFDTETEPVSEEEEQARGPDGRFQSREDSERPATGQSTPAATEAAPGIQWAPYSVNVDRAQLPIANVSVGEMQGYKVLAIKNEHWNDFNSRLTKGEVASRVWRELHQQQAEFERLRDLEMRAPQPKSDAEIEGAIVTEFMKPYFQQLFGDDPRAFELLEARVKAAQYENRAQFGDARRKYIEDEDKRFNETLTPQRELEQAATGIGQVMDFIAKRSPAEYDNIAPAVVKEMAEEIMAIRHSAYVQNRETGQWAPNVALIESTMRRIAATHRAAGTLSSGSSAAPATAGTTVAGAIGAAPKSKSQSADEKFNRGQQSGRRTTAHTERVDPRKAGTIDDGRTSRARGPRTRLEKEIEAEEDWRDATRELMRSPSLDFDFEPKARR